MQKTTRNVTKIQLQNLLQFCNVTVGVVGYFLEFVGRLRIQLSENSYNAKVLKIIALSLLILKTQKIFF